MELTFTADQAAIRSSIRSLMQQRAGSDRAREMRGSLDRELLTRLDESGFLDLATSEDSSLVDAVILVEEAEMAHATAPIAARAIVGALIPECSGAAVGLAEPRRLVRYAGLCDTYLFLDGDHSYLCESDDVKVSGVPTRWGYFLGYVEPRRRIELESDRTSRVRRLWRIALAAEMGAQMHAAVQLTAHYVTDRRQFGRPIGSYQAVSHQLATAEVHAEGTRWLARSAAADPDDETKAAVAATYACEAADVVRQATHQVTGAIGITEEYDLVLSTMRLGVLRVELGGLRAHARAAALAHWAQLS